MIRVRGREEVRKINYWDLRGLYRSVINRCIDIITNDDGELDETGHHVKSEELISAIDSFSIVGTDLPLLETLRLEEWQEDSLERLSFILASLSEVDREVSDYYIKKRREEKSGKPDR